MKPPFIEWGNLAPSIMLVTIPSTDAYDYMPEFEAPSNWRDPLKIEDLLREKTKKFIDRAGLDALTGSVAIISTYTQDEEGRKYCNHVISDAPFKTGKTGIVTTQGDVLTRISYVPDERALLHVFALAVKSVPRLIGHNLYGFTLPFLLRRMLRYSIAFDERFLPSPRYFDSNYTLDTMKAWALGNRDDEYVPMRHLSRFLFDDREIPLAFTESETFPARFALDPEAALNDLADALSLVYTVASRVYGLRA